MKLQLSTEEELIEEGSNLSDETKIETIAFHFAQIMKTLGLDLNDPSLQRTPHRVAKMYVKEIFSGLDPDNFPQATIVKDTLPENGSPSIICVKVSFTSFCEHHFVPFVGTAYVAYKPSDKLIGLSKIPRIVRHFAKRPQLQERLTAQISESLQEIMGTEDVAVSIRATHFCVIARGVQDDESEMTTNLLKGEFDSNPSLRREFFEAINR